MKRFLVIHYGEIGLKGANKQYFVKRLREHLKFKLEQKLKANFVIRESLGRMMLEMPTGISESDISEIVLKVPGVRNFQFVMEGALDVQVLADQIMTNFPESLRSAATFRVRVKRSQDLKISSMEMERELGSALLDKGLDMKAKMKGPDLEVNVEVFNEHAYFSYQKFDGLGGMSAGTGGRLVALISAGIDSPVAAFKMMRRGAKIVFVHFDGYPYTDDAEREQVKQLVQILSEYQLENKLYVVPFGEIQKQIATNLEIPGKDRTLLYRRMMVRISEAIAKKNRARGLVTGDSFAQVASQTSENLYAIHEASTIPIYQPLIAYDKEEIIEIAERIGTFEISKLPCKDTCRMFNPKHPELKANPYDLRSSEERLPVDEWVEQSVESAEVIIF